MANVVKKHSISSELAQKMVDAAVAKARELGVSENVAILDDGGNLKAFSRMDGASMPTIEIAQKKAYTALFGVSTQDVLSGDAKQSGVRLLLRNLDGRHRGPIHPAKGLEIAAVIEDRHVLANAKFSGFCHCCIHHFLCQFRRDAVFFHDVSHWAHSSLDMHCICTAR